MIYFLLKGLIRDRSRSFFPILIVATGAFLTVFFLAYFDGILSNMRNATAHNSAGHVKIMSQAYAREADQIPNDLALMNAGDLMQILNDQYPQMIWTPRIKFGGLLDIPDAHGETKTQGPVSGLAIDLLSKSSPEKKFLNLNESVVRGRLPMQPGEILIAEEFARKLQIAPGDIATLISSTMYGSMTMYNFKVAGTVRFGITAMDKGAVLADINDIQKALDMDDTFGEILGFFQDDVYNDSKATALALEFNNMYRKTTDEFSPLMKTLPEESGLADYFNLVDSMGLIIIMVFMIAMSLVLWNTALMGNLRRYGELGVRLAIGEEKKHIYLTMLAEAIMVGIIGSIIGTIIGLSLAYWMQIQGIDFSFLFKNTSLMISNRIRTKVSLLCFYIGFIPGVGSTVLGTAIAGIGIFKRKTAQLFKELEA